MQNLAKISTQNYSAIIWHFNGRQDPLVASLIKWAKHAFTQGNYWMLDLRQPLQLPGVHQGPTLVLHGKYCETNCS